MCRYILEAVQTSLFPVVSDRRIFGALGAMAAMSAVGSSVGASSLLVDYPVMLGQAGRYALAAALLFLFARGRLPPLTRRDAVTLAALALTGLAGFNVLLIAALDHADPASVGVIVGAVPLALAVGGPLFARRALSAPLIAAATVVVIGAALVQWATPNLSPLGLLLASGALAAEAAFTLLAVPVLPRIGPLATSAYACLFAAPMLLAGALLTGTELPLPDLAELAALLYLAVVVTALAFVVWYAAVRTLGAEQAGLFAGLVPITALVSGALLGTVVTTPARLVGVLLVGAGIAAGLRARAAEPNT